METDDYGSNNGLPPVVQKRIFFGRDVGSADRKLLPTYQLKSRTYLGPTAMDAEMAFLMANKALAAPGKLVYDPFVGTGSILIAAAHFGAMTMGADIDIRIVRDGRGPNCNVWSNFKQYGLPMPLGLLRADNNLPPWRHGLKELVNHGVPETLMKAVLDGCNEFFNLPMEEKMEFATKDIWKPIRFGTGVDTKVEKFFFWRDFIKVFAHPEFHFLSKPQGFSEAAQEYCKRCREVSMELLKGISESLGFEETYIEKAMNLKSGFQLFAANLYPPCPQPELAMGIPAHTDHGLLTLLIENGIGGLQIQHNGKWFHVNPLPNSFLVNTADHLEILSNGRYKSIMHRAVVNNQSTRISIAIPNGPSLDTMVSPAPELVDNESRLAAYVPMKYKDYIDLQRDGKPCLERVRLPVA